MKFPRCDGRPGLSLIDRAPCKKMLYLASVVPYPCSIFGACRTKWCRLPIIENCLYPATTLAVACLLKQLLGMAIVLVCHACGPLVCEAQDLVGTAGSWKRSDRDCSLAANSGAYAPDDQSQWLGQPAHTDENVAVVDENRRALIQLAMTLNKTNRQLSRSDDPEAEMIARLRVLLQRVKNERAPVRVASATSAPVVNDAMVSDDPGVVRPPAMMDETVDEVAIWEREREARLKLIEKLIQERVLASKAKQPPEAAAAHATDASQARVGQSAVVADSDPSSDGQSAAMVKNGVQEAENGGDITVPEQSNPDATVSGATVSGEVADNAPNTTDSADNSQQKTPLANPLAELLQQASQTPLDGPIDRLGLADNLFALGEFGLALQTYQQIDQSALEREDTQWVQYQVAGCLRHLGKPSEAADQYRKLAADRTAGRLAVLARWWLDRMTDRAILEADLQKFQQQIDYLKGTLNVNSSK